MARPFNPRRNNAIPTYGRGDFRTQLLNKILMGDLPNPMGPNDPDPYNENPNLRPVTEEDDPEGYWDARHMGNGQGQSFVVHNGQILPADPVGNGVNQDVLATLLATMGVK